MRKHDIPTPALVVDRDKLQHNIDGMADRARKIGVGLRPHIKSHKTPIIAQMQMKAGAIGITCAKLGEVEVMAAAGIEAGAAAELLGIEPELVGAHVAGRPLKAEIQVRTLLEHAWADIAHDMTYKTELKVPDRIHRQCAAVAAVLEGTDREFGRLIASLAEFKSNYGAYLEREEVEDEIKRLRIVLTSDEGNVGLAVRIAGLAISIGQHEEAEALLGPYRAEANADVKQTLGIALTERCWAQPQSPEYREGRQLLEEALSGAPANAESLCALAEAWARSDDDRARDLYRRAAEVDGTEPLTLCRYLEYEAAHSRNDAGIRLAEPMIRNAVDRCHKQIEARANLPNAWSCLAMFHLFLGQPFEAVRALGQAIQLCQHKPGPLAPAGDETPGRRPCAAGRALVRLREALNRLHSLRTILPGFEWFERMLLLGLAVRVRDADAQDALRPLASWGPSGEPHFGADASVVILAGGCTSDLEGAIGRFRPHLFEACDGRSFVLVSGGTVSGISGLAGEVAKQSGGLIRAVGYLPQYLPNNVQRGEGYTDFISSTGSDFTPLEPLQGWTDLVLSGVDPQRVKLLVYAGGKISRAECHAALALGARVGLVEDKSLPRERQIDDPAIVDAKAMVRLPFDAMTLRAFLLVDELPCEKKEYEGAARQVHEAYVRSATPADSSLVPWHKLSPDLQVSNYHQIAYAVNILASAGLSVRTLDESAGEPLDMEKELGGDGVRRLAKMEHGRWNVERLLRGWRFAPEKDVEKKLSPYLVPWDRLSAEIQGYDVGAIVNLPTSLREAKLDVFKP